MTEPTITIERHASEESGLGEELADKARAFSRVSRDPEALARMLSRWVQREVPGRAATAYWITVDGDRDKGLEVRLLSRRLGDSEHGLRLSALLGSETAGGVVMVDVLREQVKDRVWRVSLGGGVVTRYDALGEDWMPVVALSVKG